MGMLPKSHDSGYVYGSLTNYPEVEAIVAQTYVTNIISDRVQNMLNYPCTWYNGHRRTKLS